MAGKSTTRNTTKSKSTSARKAAATGESKRNSVFATMTPEERQAAFAILTSTIASRASVEQRLGKQYGDDREIYEALGYKLKPTFNDYMALYLRGDIAGTVVDLPVEDSWRVAPTITESQEEETQFEKQWKELAKKLRVYHYFERVDILASIGDYAVLFLGFDDGLPASEQVQNARQLLYLMPYSKVNATIQGKQTDPTNRRFNLPVSYTIKREDPLSGGASATAVQDMVVHHSRIIHVAEKCLESNVTGTPRLQRVLNRCEDMLKLAGGSAEMFWRGAFPGYAFKLDDGATLGMQDMDALEDEIEGWVHNLTRYIRLRGMSIQELALQVADPTGHIDKQLDLIAAASRIPKRILLGSERGELASSQDEVNWAKYIEKRQNKHCEPTIVRPFIDTLIEVGVLTEPTTGEYDVEWQDILAPGIREQVEVGKIRSEAIKNYVNAIGAEDVVPRKMFFEKVLLLTPEEIEQAEAMIEEMQREEAAEETEDTSQDHPLRPPVPVQEEIPIEEVVTP